MAATAEQVTQLSAALASCDTVDGYSLLGTSTVDTVDVDGNPIEPGVEVIDFYDGNDEYLYSCEKEGPDGWAELGVAGAETVDADGNPIAPGTAVIDFYDADGEYLGSCEKAVADGYAVQGVADADTVDADGNPIAPGQPVIHFYDSEGDYIDSCLKEGPDGYSEQGVANAESVDAAGDPIPEGSSVINFFDANGEYINSCVKAGPDGYSEQSVSSATTVDANGDPIEPNQDVIDFYDSNGVYVNSCLKSGPDGYAEQNVADADTVDFAGNPVAPGTEVINFYDENDNYVNSCVKLTVTDNDDGSADIGGCTVSAERTRLHCDDPEVGILSLSTTDLKTDEETKTPFSAVQKGAWSVLWQDGSNVVTPADVVRDLRSTCHTITLPCEQDVLFNAYYDLIVRNPTQSDISNQGANIFSYVSVNGSGGATRSWITGSDAVYHGAVGNAGSFQPIFYEEQNRSGSAVLTLPAGTHEICYVVSIWRSRNNGLELEFSNVKITSSWTQMECK